MHKLAVEISLSNGANLAGKIQVPVQARLTDVLNDDRGFLPVECTDGSFLALSKRAIERITLPSAEGADGRGNDSARTWIALTDTQERPIYVNMEHAVTIKRTTSSLKRSTTERTVIGFIGSDNETVSVVETPQQILAMLSAARREDGPHERPGTTQPYLCQGETGTAAESNDHSVISCQ